MAIIKKFRIKSFKKLNPIIKFENVSLSYGNRLILDNLNFNINEGQIFGMLGPNGVVNQQYLILITGLLNLEVEKFNFRKDATLSVYLRTKNLN